MSLQDTLSRAFAHIMEQLKSESANQTGNALSWDDHNLLSQTANALDVSEYEVFLNTYDGDPDNGYRGLTPEKEIEKKFGEFIMNSSATLPSNVRHACRTLCDNFQKSYAEPKLAA